MGLRAQHTATSPARTGWATAGRARPTSPYGSLTIHIEGETTYRGSDYDIATTFYSTPPSRTPHTTTGTTASREITTTLRSNVTASWDDLSVVRLLAASTPKLSKRTASLAGESGNPDDNLPEMLNLETSTMTHHRANICHAMRLTLLKPSTNLHKLTRMPQNNSGEFLRPLRNPTRDVLSTPAPSR